MDSSMDAFSQLAMCCGLGANRRREFREAQNYYYSPSSAYLAGPPRPASAFANPYAAAAALAPPHQPYLLVTQPVILAATSPVHQQHQNPTLTLVQQAHQHPLPGGGHHRQNISTLSILGAEHLQQQHQLASLRNNLISSQYALYSSPSHLLSGAPPTHSPISTFQQHQSQQQESIYGQLAARPLNRNLSTQMLCNKQSMLNMSTTGATPVAKQQQQPLHQQEPPPVMVAGQKSATVSLSSEVFRQLEKVERLVDLSRDLELVERLGVVIARALDPYSLVPHFTMDTLRSYHERFIFNASSVIRFIEIIKKPGQTLGLYIRSVQFEDPRLIRPTRAGLVVTKIDSDSPIYNNQVLHVGDEILSVNLVDMEGMSLDDVVVIMSIPKRLVLALRVPRERMLEDGAMMQQLIQQQQQQQQLTDHSASGGSRFYDTMAPVGKLQDSQFSATQQAGLYGFDEPAQRTPIHQLRSESRPQEPANQSVVSITRAPEHTSSYFSSSIDAINRELKELRRQRMALSNNEQSLDGEPHSGLVTAEFRENLL